jgi:SAM-dependent methyltransferase
MRFSLRENRGLKSKLKSWLLPAGRSPRRIRFGLLGGLSMQLDLASDSQRWLGLQERELYRWVRRLGRGIHTAFDVGANDGMYTLYFLARTSARKIYSFEPSADSVQALEQNLALNRLAGEPRLEIADRKVGSISGDGWATLDSFAAAIEPPCLLKVDIDGGEGDLLRGARQCLGLRGMRWIIEVHSKALEQECLQTLKEAGYRVVIVPNAWWRHVIPELRPGELNHWLVAYRDEANEKTLG